MKTLISLGTNLGDRLFNLESAKKLISKHWALSEESRVYESRAVDYLNQPDFLNQVVAYDTPNETPERCLRILLSIEEEMGRLRHIPKGPRVIDLDLLFCDLLKVNTQELQLPHPRLFARSFIVLPLKELDYFSTLRQKFNFPDSFCNEAFPLKT